MSIWLHEERIHLSQRRENVRISGARVKLYVKSGCRCRNTHFQANPVQIQAKGSKGVKVVISRVRSTMCEAIGFSLEEYALLSLRRTGLGTPPLGGGEGGR